MKIAVIPARGGSKRIPRKNIKIFNGKPMIAWSIEAAFASGCFDEVWVSTDDQEIAEVATEYGATIPFVRPEHLSKDHATTIDVMAHAVGAYKELHDVLPEYVCCIYATAPFVRAQDIQQGLQLLQENSDFSFAFSATTYPFPIQRAIRLDNAGHVTMFDPEQFTTRSQDLEEAYHDAGQFYWGRAEAWLQKHNIFSNKSKLVLLPRYRVQDIDTPEDWKRAELLSKLL